MERKQKRIQSNPPWVIVCVLILFSYMLVIISPHHNSLLLLQRYTKPNPETFTDPFVEKHDEFRDLSCEQWVVLVANDTLAGFIWQVGKMTDWCTVIVGGENTPENYVPVDIPTTDIETGVARLLFLNYTAQQSLGYEITKYTGDNQETRKNIGYLFAIQHGANIVYDAETDNLLKFDSIPVETFGGHTNLIRKANVSNLFFNPLPEFNCRATGNGLDHPLPCWQRGFPIEMLRVSGVRDHELTNVRKDNRISSGVQTASVGVIHFLADHNPDFDSMNLLSAPARKAVFRTGLKSVAVPPGTFAPYNKMSTMVKRKALWSLLLPSSLHSRVADVWRAYIAQRLLWEQEQYLVITSPRVVRCSKSHDLFANLKAEAPLYESLIPLAKRLASWQGVHSRSFPELFEAVYVYLEHNGLVSAKDVNLARAWLHDLKRIGYEFPILSDSPWLPHGGFPNQLATSEVPRTIIEDEQCIGAALNRIEKYKFDEKSYYW